MSVPKISHRALRRAAHQHLQTARLCREYSPHAKTKVTIGSGGQVYVPESWLHTSHAITAANRTGNKSFANHIKKEARGINAARIENPTRRLTGAQMAERGYWMS